MKYLMTIVIALALAACDIATQPHAKHGSVTVYEQLLPDSNTIYWYILYSDVNGIRTPYYYESLSKLSSFGNVRFTRGEPPKNVEEEIEEGKLNRVDEEELTEDQLPADVEEDITVETESDGGSTGDGGSD